MFLGASFFVYCQNLIGFGSVMRESIFVGLTIIAIIAISAFVLMGETTSTGKRGGCDIVGCIEESIKNQK